MTARRLIAAALALSMAAGLSPVRAQVSLGNLTEKVTLKGKRGPKLTQPGFEVGEYSGFYSALAVSREGFGSMDKARADFQLTWPGLATPVTARCQGGQSALTVAWITWKREPLAYNCTFGGGAPADAALTLAVGEGSFLQRLQQPLRAGELRWNGMTIRFDTKQVGGNPVSGGKPLGYVFSRDGKDVGGVDLGGGFTPPAFFLPAKGAAERDPMMVAAIALFVFPDPGRGG